MVIELLKERWTQWAAIVTTILAVSAAIASLKGGGYSTKVQLLTTQQTNAWSYYQAKSTKQHISEAQRDVFQIQLALAKGAAERKVISPVLDHYQADIKRYDKEKGEIKAQAEQLGKDADSYKRHSGDFGLAVMLLQIAIMLNSVGVVIKKQFMWFIGIVFGAAGLFYMFLGFFA
jgi:hypothetical protein